MTAYSERKNERRGLQLERMLKLIKLLESTIESRIPELAQQLNVSQRTVRQDLQILARLNWAQQTEDANGRSVWVWLQDL